MFVTKKKFNQLREELNANVDTTTRNNKLLQLDTREADDKRKIGDDTLSKIVKRHKEEAESSALGVDSFVLLTEARLEELSNRIERNHCYVGSACLKGDSDSEEHEERLREAETRIDNLIETHNDAVLRHNSNIYTSNEAIDKCNERFAKYDALIGNLESQIQTQAAISKLAENRASFAAVLAVEFESRSTVEIGKTFWLKVQRHGGELMEQGTWNGLFFDQPDGQRLPHEYVLEVGEEIETPIIED